MGIGCRRRRLLLLLAFNHVMAGRRLPIVRSSIAAVLLLLLVFHLTAIMLLMLRLLLLRWLAHTRGTWLLLLLLVVGHVDGCHPTAGAGIAAGSSVRLPGAARVNLGGSWVQLSLRRLLRL